MSCFWFQRLDIYHSPRCHPTGFALLALTEPATWDVHLVITIHATTSWFQTSWYESCPKFLICLIIMKAPLNHTCVNNNPPPFLPSLLSLKVYHFYQFALRIRWTLLRLPKIISLCAGCTISEGPKVILIGNCMMA